MNWVETILAPVDLSRPAEERVQYARRVGAALGADVHLLYVADDDSPRVSAERWPASAGLDRAVLHGVPAVSIAEHANSIDAEFVLMTSGRYGSWTRFWRKSVTEEVMRLSRRPVWVTLAESADQDFCLRTHRILCVVGLDDRETLLMQHAQDMAERYDAELILLHVVPEPSEALLYRAMDAGTRPLSKEHARRAIADLTYSFGVEAQASVLMGDPRKCIPAAAREHSADLVMVSRDRTGLRAAYGADIERLVGTLRCPVLTVPVNPSVQSMDENFDRAASEGQVRSALFAVRRGARRRREHFRAVRTLRRHT